jgi:hypothetical protein
MLDFLINEGYSGILGHGLACRNAGSESLRPQERVNQVDQQCQGHHASDPIVKHHIIAPYSFSQTNANAMQATKKTVAMTM